MNRNDLEKMFDEKFFIQNWNIPVKEYVEIKDYIFNEIIPEVFKSVIPNKEFEIIYWARDAFRLTKRKIKKLYNITI